MRFILVQPIDTSETPRRVCLDHIIAWGSRGISEMSGPRQQAFLNMPWGRLEVTQSVGELDAMIRTPQSFRPTS